jgi:prepilin-type N-terminal cleavage/methylation domain-containing protein
MQKGWAPRRYGFTVIELLMVIAVIAILAAVTIVAYNGISKAAAVRTVQSDLSNASAEMERVAQANGGDYPGSLPSTITASPNATIALYTSPYPHYSAMTNVQNGVLLSQICQDLINAGLGSGLNLGGGTDNYITGCGNWNAGSMQVTGWNSHVFHAPIYDNTFTDYADAIPPYDAWHPHEQAVTQNFYRQMHDRLLAEGGAFPVTTFWDSWATPSNGGVIKQSLPAADVITDDFCIDGGSIQFSDVHWHVTSDQKIVTGTCGS